MKKKKKDRADRLWLLIHMTAIRLTQEKRQPVTTGKLTQGYLTDASLTIGGEVQATPMVQRRG